VGGAYQPQPIVEQSAEIAGFFGYAQNAAGHCQKLARKLQTSA